MVFCALQWYADDGHLARRAHDGSRRPPRLVRIVRGALVARELVVQRRLGDSRVRMQRGRGYVGNEVFVEAASLAGVVIGRGQPGGAGAEAGNAVSYRASLGVEVRFPHVVSCCEGRMARLGG